MKPIKVLAISPDGQFALHNKNNTTVQLMQLATDNDNHKVIREFKLPYDSNIFTASNNKYHYLIGKFSSCGKYVLFGTAYYYNRPRHFNVCMRVDTGLAVEVAFYKHNCTMENCVNVAYSHDGLYLVFADSDKSIILTDVVSGKLCAKLLTEADCFDEEHEYHYEYCYFSPSNRYLMVSLTEQPEDPRNNEYYSPVWSTQPYPAEFNQRLIIIDVSSGDKIYGITFRSTQNLTIEFSPLEKNILVGLQTRNSVEWEIIESTSGGTVANGKGQMPRAFNENSLIMFSQSTLIKSDLSGQANLSKLYSGFTLTKACLSPNEQYLALELTKNYKDPEKHMVLIRMTDGVELLRRSASQFVFTDDSKAIFLLLRNGQYAYLLRQFLTADGKECAQKEMHDLQTSWIHSVLADGRVIMKDTACSWIEELNRCDQEKLLVPTSSLRI